MAAEIALFIATFPPPAAALFICLLCLQTLILIMVHPRSSFEAVKGWTMFGCPKLVCRMPAEWCHLRGHRLEVERRFLSVQL
eukprot:365856-Chlamydomonas_euryale.AAC.15